MTLYTKSGEVATYPITITEVPHRGAPRTWTLYDDNHLRVNIQAAQSRSDFTGATLAEYLDWLASDLQRLVIEDSPV